jgi:hypothetical protein
MPGSDAIGRGALFKVHPSGKRTVISDFNDPTKGDLGLLAQGSTIVPAPVVVDALVQDVPRFYRRPTPNMKGRRKPQRSGSCSNRRHTFNCQPLTYDALPVAARKQKEAPGKLLLPVFGAQAAY